MAQLGNTKVLGNLTVTGLTTLGSNATKNGKELVVATDKGETANKTLTYGGNFKVLQVVGATGEVNERTMTMPAALTLSTITGTLGVSKGGTGQTTLTSGSLLVGNGTNAVNFMAKATKVQAEAGSLDNVYMTPAMTKDAINALSPTGGMTLLYEGTATIPTTTTANANNITLNRSINLFNRLVAFEVRVVTGTDTYETHVVMARLGSNTTTSASATYDRLYSWTTFDGRYQKTHSFKAYCANSVSDKITVNGLKHLIGDYNGTTIAWTTNTTTTTYLEKIWLMEESYQALQGTTIGDVISWGGPSARWQSKPLPNSGFNSVSTYSTTTTLGNQSGVDWTQGHMIRVQLSSSNQTLYIPADTSDIPIGAEILVVFVFTAGGTLSLNTQAGAIIHSASNFLKIAPQGSVRLVKLAEAEWSASGDLIA